MELKLDLSEEALKILVYLQENLLGGSLYSVTLKVKNISLQFYWNQMPPKTFCRVRPARLHFLKSGIFISEKSLPFLF